MKVVPLPDRQEYVSSQIQRSRVKFDYNKVSYRDAQKYHAVLSHYGRVSGNIANGPIVCLGVRGGREVDLFRIEWFGRRWQRLLARLMERRHHGFSSPARPLERLGQSNVQVLSKESVLGVEINPDGRRQDVLVASFDELPAAWSGVFGVIYSNAFDHSQDPERTAREWRRIAAPGAFLVLCYTPQARTSVTDPVGDLTMADVRRLFPGEIVFLAEHGSRNGYTEIITRLE